MKLASMNSGVCRELHFSSLLLLIHPLLRFYRIRPSASHTDPRISIFVDPEIRISLNHGFTASICILFTIYHLLLDCINTSLLNLCYERDEI